MTLYKYPILYSFRRCPYAMRARFSIRLSGIKVELREILLKKKPEEFLNASIDGTVPILVISNEIIIQESLDIVNWSLKSKENGILELHDPENLLSFCDNDFKMNLDHYKYPTRYKGINPIHHRNENVKYLTLLNNELKYSKFLSSDKLNYWYSLIVESLEFNDIMKKYKVWEPSDSPLITNFIT